ncbi:hypothetical protein OF83DRAFT_1178761, partial [Amylostereum chailletii]
MRVPHPKDDDLLLGSVDRSMWELRPDSGDERVLKPGLRLAFRTAIDQAKARAAVLFPQVRQDPASVKVLLPHLSLERATDAYGKLITGVDCWADFVLAMRGLQRSLLEVSAFFEWWARRPWAATAANPFAASSRVWGGTIFLHRSTTDLALFSAF